MNEKYQNRCLKKLKELNAPNDGWQCASIDEYEVLTTCALCGCTKVRYLHMMHHAEYAGTIGVGCVCAGIMEGDELAARQRDNEARNRSQRRLRFVSKGWKETHGTYTRNYRGAVYRIMPGQGQYAVFYNGKWCWKCQGKPMTSFSKAAGAIFHLIDPPVGVRHA